MHSFILYSIEAVIQSDVFSKDYSNPGKPKPFLHSVFSASPFASLFSSNMENSVDKDKAESIALAMPLPHHMTENM
eukprot:Awhi_evm1s6089